MKGDRASGPPQDASDTPLTLRRATGDDAESLTRILIRARRAAMPDVAPVIGDAGIARWMREDVVATKRVIVACIAGVPAGFVALRDDRLDQIYVDPDAQGRGVGRALMDVAKRAAPEGFTLVVFARNAHARAFYERSGLVLDVLRDGSNAEGEAEAIYRWPGAAR